MGLGSEIRVPECENLFRIPDPGSIRHRIQIRNTVYTDPESRPFELIYYVNKNLHSQCVRF
jgi:hypothetical protein